MRAQVAERDGRLGAGSAARDGPSPAARTAELPRPRARGGALRRRRGRQRRGAARSCSTSSACTRSTAARRSTPRPTTCWPASTTVPTEEVVLLTEQRERDHGGRARRAACRTSRCTSRRPPASRPASPPPWRSRPTAPSRRTRRRSREALARVRTGAVAPAARDDARGASSAATPSASSRSEVLRLGRSARDAAGGAARRSPAASTATGRRN